MLPPPGISLRNPEGVEPRIFTGLRHGNGLAHRLHAELQNTDVEWNRHDLLVAPNPDSSATKSHNHPVRQHCHPEPSELNELDVILSQAKHLCILPSAFHSGSFHECSSPLISSHSALFSGVAIPTSLPQCTIAPFMKSISVCRLASTSCSMLARCLPGAFAPFCTSCRGSPCNSIPSSFATASPSAIRSLKSCPVGSNRVAAPWCNSVSAPTGFVAALKISLVHCAPRASFKDIVFIPERVSSPASSSTLSIEVLVSSNGPIQVSPLMSYPMCPGAIGCPAGKVVPRITNCTRSAIISS